MARTGLHVYYPICTISGANAKGNECEADLSLVIVIVCLLECPAALRQPTRD
jgi:hypothetical protein